MLGATRLLEISNIVQSLVEGLLLIPARHQ
jgi:hypothetical protein